MLFAEKGIVAGGFMWMLYLFLTRFGKSQDAMVVTLLEISTNMKAMGTDLAEMNDRIKRVEDKVDDK